MTNTSFSVSIIDDDIVEKDETFRLIIIEHRLPNIIFKNRSTTVTIRNDDTGKCYM